LERIEWGWIRRIEWHKIMGRDISENGICYIVTSCRDIGSSCEKGSFAVYGETTPKIIARG
jgi:hypothetical protein